MKPTQQAISFVIWNQNRDKILAVQRPSDDENLPNVWGLPAGNVRENESFEDCVIRAGQEKLGVEIEIIQTIGEGEIERSQYILHMKEFEVKIVSGEPIVPQNTEGVTKYQS